MLQRLFRHLQRNQCLLTTWQVDPQSGKRSVYHSTLGSFHTDMKRVSFSLTEKFELNPNLELFFYAEDGQFIFKTQIEQMNGQHFLVTFPKEIQLLEDPEARMMQERTGVEVSKVWKSKRLEIDKPETFGVSSDLSLKAMSDRSSRDQEFLNNEFNPSLDEEDKMFADKRESVRVRPKVQKQVRLMVQGDENLHVMKLFDLSQGGMAFLTLRPEEFPKGTQVIVMGFGTFDLDDPLIGTIASARPVDDTNVEHKIGIKFTDGQA